MKLKQRSPLPCNSIMAMGALAGKGTFWLLAPSVVYRECCFCSVSDGDFLSCVRRLQLHNLGILIKQPRETCSPLPGQGCSRTAALPSRAARGRGGGPFSCALGCSEPAQPPAGRTDPGKSEMEACSRLSDRIKHWWRWDGKKRGRNCCFFSSESYSLGLLCLSKR